jgi:hypothetical protein
VNRLILFAALTFALVAVASDVWVGRLYKASGSVSNSTTTDDAGTFVLQNVQGVGARYAIQCLSDSCVATSKDAGLSVGCANQGTNPAFATPAEAIAGGLLFDLPLSPNFYGVAAVATDGGIVSCDVYRVAVMGTSP